MYTGWRQIDITENNRTMNVLVPVSDDRVENKDLEQFAIGKTKDDLRKRQPKEEKKLSQKDTTLYLKDKIAFDERKKSGTKKYF